MIANRKMVQKQDIHFWSEDQMQTFSQD